MKDVMESEIYRRVFKKTPLRERLSEIASNVHYFVVFFQDLEKEIEEELETPLDILQQHRVEGNLEMVQLIQKTFKECIVREHGEKKIIDYDETVYKVKECTNPYHVNLKNAYEIYKGDLNRCRDGSFSGSLMFLEGQVSMLVKIIEEECK
jgi:transcriptional regulator with PAS, ATPase and Fis domain